VGHWGPTLVFRYREGVPCKASSWPNREWGVGRVCRLRLHPGQRLCLGVGRVCRLGLHPGLAVRIVRGLHNFVENASLKLLQPMVLSGEERVRTFYSYLAEIKF